MVIERVHLAKKRLGTLINSRVEMNETYFDKLMGYFMASQFMLLGTIFDNFNDRWPHCWDGLSKAIENNVGNVWPSALLAIFIKAGLETVKWTANEIKPLTEKEDRVVKQAIPVITMAAVGLVNVATEWQPGNYEFAGDVVWGIAGGLVALGIIKYVPEMIPEIVRWGRNRIKNSQNLHTDTQTSEHG